MFSAHPPGGCISLSESHWPVAFKLCESYISCDRLHDDRIEHGKANRDDPGSPSLFSTIFLRLCSESMLLYAFSLPQPPALLTRDITQRVPCTHFLGSTAPRLLTMTCMTSAHRTLNPFHHAAFQCSTAYAACGRFGKSLVVVPRLYWTHKATFLSTQHSRKFHGRWPDLPKLSVNLPNT